MIAVLYQLNVESDNPDKWQQAAQACVACNEGERVSERGARIATLIIDEECGKLAEATAEMRGRARGK